ncbi:MAG: hypothetical protein ACE5J1_05735 [Nitrospiria bacterium]
MRKGICLHKLLTIFIVGMFALQMSGCGTLLYPERRGQTSGRIDPAVAILDGVGLLFFVVPGLVAFAVDFSTGAIYLPPGSDKSELKDTEKMRVVHADPDRLNLQRFEEIIAKETGHPVDLDRKDLVVSKLRKPEDFLARYDKMAASGEIPEEMVNKVRSVPGASDDRL